MNLGLLGKGTCCELQALLHWQKQDLVGTQQVADKHTTLLEEGLSQSSVINVIASGVLLRHLMLTLRKRTGHSFYQLLTGHTPSRVL